MFFSNPFVYDQVYASDINNANIPTLLEEQYAQCGEDIIILSIIRALRINYSADDAVCVEIGANHAFAGSNTFLLGKSLGIKSILVEANPSLIKNLKKARPNDIVINTAIVDSDLNYVDLFISHQNELSSLSKDFVEDWHQGTIGVKEVCKVPALRINNFLKNNISEGMEIPLLSIDVEGMDLRIAQDLDFSRWRPLFVQMEPSEHFLEGEGEKMIEHMSKNEYFLISKTKVNLIFIDKKKMIHILNGTPINNAEFKEGSLMKIDAESVSMNIESCQKDNPYERLDIISSTLSKDFGSPLSNWKVDAEFVNKVLDLSKSGSVVSFDIFDTALTRIFESPADLFAEVERKLLLQYGINAKGFAIARERAEKFARDKHYSLSKAEEVNFLQIYEELPQFLPEFKDSISALKVELDVERESLFAVPDILKLTQELTAKNIPFIFVSDMYLPGDFLADVLNSVGYKNWRKLFVSCEMRATKATGKIWDQVRNLIGENTEIVHVGDDEHSDVINPKKYKIKTVEYSRAKSERKVGAKSTPYLAAYSKFKRKFILNERANPQYKFSNEDLWFQLGRTTGGVVLISFVNWLAERVRKNKIEKLYFCARDGYLVQKAWIAAGFDKKIPINISYLNVSRAVLNIASGIAESSSDSISQDLLRFLSSTAGKTTVKDALKRADLLEVNELVKEVSKSFGSLDKKLNYPEQTNLFEKILQDNSQIIYKKLYEKYDVCIKYLKQEGLLEKSNVAIVDMGWHGTMQKSINILIKSGGGLSSIHGFYYGLWGGAIGNRYATGPMESCFANEFQKPQDVIGLQQGVALLEQLHSAPHGSTVGYEFDSDRKIIPIYKKNEMELNQHSEITSFFQNGALKTVENFYLNFDENFLQFDINIALAAVESLTLSPSNEELNLVESMGHCATFDHSTHDPIILRKIPSFIEEVENILIYSDWKFGQLKLWWNVANDHQKELLKNKLFSNFGYLDNKIISQFK